jgi:low affinity Fe/Cu permease
MSKKQTQGHEGASKGLFERIAHAVTKFTGSSLALMLAGGTIIVWAISGPFFNFDETWQLVINTGTTIVTFLMVFLIQRAQNKDSQALHLKLNELVAAMQGASNRLIAVEDLSEKEVEILHQHYCQLAELSKRDNELTESHSVEEATDRHESKQQHRGKQSSSQQK